MSGHVMTKGRTEYQIRVFGRLIVIYVEVELGAGTGDDHLDAVEQLIAEADGMCSLTPVPCLDVFLC